MRYRRQRPYCTHNLDPIGKHAANMQPLPRAAKLKTPVNQKQLTAFKEAFGIETDSLTVMLNAELDQVLQQVYRLQEHEPSCKGLMDSLADQGINSQTTEALSEKLQQILVQANPIAQTTCDYTKAGQSDYMKYPKRTASRKNKALTEYRTALNHAIQQHDSCTRNDVHDWHQQIRVRTEESRKNLNCEYQQRLPQPPQTTDTATWTHWKENCKRQQQKEKSDAAKLRDQDRQSSLSKAKRRLQTQYLRQ